MEEKSGSYNKLKRHNHYLPEMYLEKWANDNKLFEYRLLVSHEEVPIWVEKSIGSVASQDNLYIHMKSGVEYDDIEVFFDTEFESPAKEPLDKACTTGKLSAEEWHKLISFVCVQYVRTPSFFQWMRNFAKEAGPSIIESAAELLEEVDNVSELHLEKPPGSEFLPISLEITDIHPDDKHTLVGVNFISGKGLWFFGITHMLQRDSDFMIKMHSFKWSIITAHEEVCWPTSDSPFIISTLNNKQFRLHRDGIERENVFIFFPISPKKVLVASEKRFFNYRHIADKNLSKIIKEMIIGNAFMYIYSDCEDSSIPEYRHRVVDMEEFKRVQNEYKEWYKMYIDEEVPLLRV